jgi:hypothetical protein
MPLILGTNSIKDTGYDVANSLRFNSGSSDNLSKSLSTPTNDKKFTFSCWFKKSKNATEMNLFGYQPSGNAEAYIGFSTSDEIRYADRDSGDTTAEIFLVSNAKLRDVSAWYHVVVSVDTTQGTDSNRAKLYLNGEQITSLANSTYPSQNYTPEMNSSDGTKVIGADNNGNYFNGYIAETVFIDGTALDPTSFGEFDSDSPTIWKPKDVSGLTFGTNGFYLDFENSGSLGADVSGNGNNFTVNNLTSIDQSTDTCTNNFATFNPLVAQSTGTFSEGNCKNASSSSTNFGAVSTMGVSSGKWYAEFKPVSATGNKKRLIGACGNISGNGTAFDAIYMYGLNTTGDSGSETINTIVNTTETDVTSSYTGYFENDIVGVALDMDNNKIYFSVNGTFENSSNPVTGTGGLSLGTSPPDGVFYFTVMDVRNADVITYEANFGNPPYAISSGNSDANGFGNFEYAVPSGYFALCTKNLAEFG